MTASIRAEFQVGGIRDVQQAFRSVEDSVRAAERAAIESARAQERAWKEASRELARMERERSSEAKRAVKEREAETKKASNAEAKAWADTNKELAKLDKERLSEQKARLKESVRAFEDAQREKTRAAKREAEEQARFEESFAKSRARETIGARTADFRKTVGGYAGGMASTGINMAGNAAALAGGVFGGFQAADAVKKLNGFESAAVNLSNATYIPDMKGPNGEKIEGTKRAKVSDIMDIAKEGQAATGFDKDELLTAWQSYVEKSSDASAFSGDDPAKRKAGKETLFGLAKLAKGSGTNIMELMGAAGALKTQNDNISSEDMMKTMLNVVGQGKLGAISMADLASHSAIITASAGQFSMGQTEAQRSLLGLSQIAYKTAGTAPMAATAVSNFVAETTGKQKQLRAMGVEVNDFNKDGSKKGIRDPGEIISEIFKKTGGDMAKIQAIYGERGIKPFESLKTTYDAAEGEAKVKDPKAKKGEAGSLAVLKTVQKFERMGYAPKDAEDDFKAVQGTRTEQFNQAMLKVQDAFQTSLLPALEQFVTYLPQLTTTVSGAIKFFADHPFQGIGAMIGAAIAKDMAAAGIQKLITNAFSSASGAMSLGSIAVTAGIAYLAYNKLAEEADKEKDAVADRSMLGSKEVGIEAELKAAGNDPAKIREVLAKAKSFRGDLVKAKDENQQETVGDKVLGAASHLPGAAGEAARESQAVKTRVANDQHTSIVKSLSELDKAIAAAAAKLSNTAATIPGSASTHPEHPDRNAPMSGGARGGTMH